MQMEITFPPRQASLGRISLGRALLATLLLAMSIGCSKTPPEITPVEGVLRMGGFPVPNAYVQFIPQLDEFGAEYNSSATTDDAGKFTLTCHHGPQPGAAVCQHRVLITEAPASEEFRGMDGASQANYANHLRMLKNRPIPDSYSTVLHTPLMIEVKKDQQQYELVLTR